MSPERIGRFTILRKLGQGGMGEVFLGEDPAIGRRVAIKTISSTQVPTPAMRERFLREAKAAGTLSHPNIITVHEFGEDQGLLYLVMEFLPGKDLSTFLTNRSLSPRECLEVMAQICDGLAYAHGKGVIHRDIKPSNIGLWRDEGRLIVKILDFGVARLPGSDLTVTGALVGTYVYMAPEYLQTRKADPRCDIYAVGVMLKEALLGVRPDDGPTRALDEDGELQAPAPRPDPFKGISPGALDIIHKTLAIDPERRFQTARELAEVLRSAQAEDWSGIAPPSQLPSRINPGGTASEGAIIPTLVTPISQRVEKGRISLPPLPVPEPEEAWWRRHWGWGVMLLALALLAKMGLGPGPKPTKALPPRMQEEVGREGPALKVIQEEPRRPEDSRRPDRPEPVLGSPVTEGQPGPLPPPRTEPMPPPLPEAQARPLALEIVDLYRQGRFEAMLEALKRANDQGLTPYDLGAVTEFRGMLQGEASQHRIPRPTWEAMQAYLPRPRREPGDGGEGRPKPRP